MATSATTSTASVASDASILAHTASVPTSRSALGIHNCYPGVGCICIPDREQLTSLADAVRRYNINRLKVVD